MPTEKQFDPSPKHRTSLSLIADSQTTISLFGKVVEGISLTPSGLGITHPYQDDGTLHAGQIFGYMRNHQCVQLNPPQIFMLPAPVGPADACGWDPDHYVMWKVPADWQTLFLHVSSGAVSERLLQIEGNDTLSADQCLRIASDCVFDVTQNPQQIDRSRTLQSYGINSSEQASGVRTRVVSNPSLGVGRFNFQISTSALKDANGSWTLGQLADRVQEAAAPVSQLAFVKTGHLR